MFGVVVILSRRVTTISLDDRSYAQAKSVGNLSAFVRQQLEEEHQKQNNVPLDYHNAMRPHPLNMCYPYQGDGVCSICWPFGRPTKEAWKDWSRSAQWAARNYELIPEPPNRLPDQRKSIYPDQVPNEESSETLADKPGIIRRFLRFFW